MTTAAQLAILLSLVTAALLGCAVFRVRGTTLLAPALWTAGSVLAIGGVEFSAVLVPHMFDGHGPIRYAAATLTLCPMVAVLGAKRPQDRAWQWVVLALLATVWLPAARCLLLDRGGSLYLSPAWQFFLAILVLLGPLNYLPTNNWLPALLAAGGQCVLLAPYTALGRRLEGDLTSAAALAAFLITTGIVWFHAWRNQRREAGLRSGSLDELNASWIRFRNAFGAFWAIRVVQRVNQGVRAIEPDFELTWHGWRGTADEEGHSAEAYATTVAQAAGKAMRIALRRFVQVRQPENHTRAQGASPEVRR